MARNNIKPTLLLEMSDEESDTLEISPQSNGFNRHSSSSQLHRLPDASSQLLSSIIFGEAKIFAYRRIPFLDVLFSMLAVMRLSLFVEASKYNVRLISYSVF